MRKKKFGLAAAVIFAPLAAMAQIPEGKQIEAEADSVAIPTYETLDDLVVIAQRPAVTVEGSTIKYNVSEDPASKSQSVLELLRKVPLVSVDGNDNIRINGKGDIRIYVDGKEEPMLTQNASTILKSLPASYVQNVEVIVDPGAKYDAEGVGGILNLVTQKMQSENGYNGRLTLSLGRANNYLNAFGTARVNKVSMKANLIYANGTVIPQSHETRNETFYHSPEFTGTLLNLSKQKVKFNYFDADLGMAWEPTACDLFTLGAKLNYTPGNLTLFREREIQYDAAENLMWSRLQEYSGGIRNANISANASYQHNFSDTKHNLILSYRYNFGRNHMFVDGEYTDYKNITPLFLFQSNDMRDYLRENTFQIDYTNDFRGSNHLLETGAKAILRHNGTISNTLAGNDANSLIDLPGALQNLAQIQNIYSVYAAYNGKFGALAARAGVRYEHTDMGINYHAGDESDFRNHLDDVVPNASLTYMFDPATNIMLSYKMRIARPTLSQINPYEMSIRENEVRVGNPHLGSEHNNTISLSFTKFGRVLGGKIGVDLSRTGNAISEWNHFVDNVLYSTYDNIGSNRSANFNGFLNWNIISGMSVNLSGAVEYVSLKAPSLNVKNHGWNTNWQLGWNYSAPHDWKYSAFGGFSSRSYTLQGRSGAWNYYGLSAGKDFLPSKRLNVTLSAMNFLQSRQKYVSTVNTADASRTSTYKFISWNVGVSVSWSFGKSNVNLKETDAKILNDDSSNAGVSDKKAQF